LHVLFQPHQHSRTARFIDEFVESLRAADRVVVAQVYGARAHIDRVGAGAEDLVVRLRRASVEAVFGGDASSSVRALADKAPAGSAALILGAGDIDLYKDELARALTERRAASRTTTR
jgi:UDP-N-acetylmuramate--alanine ligase